MKTSHNQRDDPQQPIDRSRPPHQVRVLVVEDEPGLREQLTRSVREWGFDATPVWSGEDAIRLNDAQPFDIAILDLSLPGMDGIETLAAVRNSAPDLQGIILTGSATVDAAKRAIHLGIVEFLTKPCDRGELERALDRARRRVPIALPLPEAPKPAPPPAPTLEDVERRHILAVLEHNQGDRSATAQQLGVSRKTLYNKLRDYMRQGFAIR